MTVSQKLSIGFSPCPNDTHIFYAMTHGKIPLSLARFNPEILADVETLNSWAMVGKLDVTKLSFHAMGLVMDQYQVLDSGAALGRGSGPLLIAASKLNEDAISNKKIAIPGRYTTAALLLKMFDPRCDNLVPMQFDEIMPAVLKGRVDAGLIIHESRFTYQEKGLKKIVDLGAWWEEQTGLAIPLGCIAAKRTLADEVISEIDTGIHKSILYARNHPEECSSYISSHAQELSPDVISNHINLYVNDFSLSLGREGRSAINEFYRRGKEAGVFPKLYTI